jgi:hypothetical protein
VPRSQAAAVDVYDFGAPASAGTPTETHATITVTFNNNPDDGDTVTITAIRFQRTFEFDVARELPGGSIDPDYGIISGNIRTEIGSTKEDTAENFKEMVNGWAVPHVTASRSGAVVTLTHENGAEGNSATASSAGGGNEPAIGGGGSFAGGVDADDDAVALLFKVKKGAEVSVRLEAAGSENALVVTTAVSDDDGANWAAPVDADGSSVGAKTVVKDGYLDYTFLLHEDLTHLRFVTSGSARGNVQMRHNGSLEISIV